MEEAQKEKVFEKPRGITVFKLYDLDYHLFARNSSFYILYCLEEFPIKLPCIQCNTTKKRVDIFYLLKIKKN